MQTAHTATGTHVPYRITQCYLPPGRGDIPALTPAEAGGTMLVNLGTAIKVCSPCPRLHATVGLEFCVTHGDCCGCCGRWRIVVLTTRCTTLPSCCTTTCPILLVWRSLWCTSASTRAPSTALARPTAPRPGKRCGVLHAANADSTVGNQRKWGQMLRDILTRISLHLLSLPAQRNCHKVSS